MAEEISRLYFDSCAFAEAWYKFSGMATKVFAGFAFGLVMRKMVLLRRNKAIFSTVIRAAFDIGMSIVAFG